jgi:hypothetical protein
MDGDPEEGPGGGPIANEETLKESFQTYGPRSKLEPLSTNGVVSKLKGRQKCAGASGKQRWPTLVSPV